VPTALALALALLQGLTEFLPVSSSGHLALAQTFSGAFAEPPILFDVWLHLATLAAILVYYRREVAGYLRPGRLAHLVLATAVTGAVGLALKPLAEASFGVPAAVALFLLATAAVLWVTARLPVPEERPLDWRRAALVGLAQGAAVFPGLSRSGLTICAGVRMGIDPSRACEFSFILSVPAILLADGLELWQHRATLGTVQWGTFGAAFALAFGAGLASIHWTRAAFSRNRLQPFALYLLALSLASIGYDVHRAIR